MSIIEILEDNLTGEPIKDAFIIGILFIIIWSFYNVMFESIFTIFKK